MGAVKGGRSPAQRTLDGDHRTRQSSLAECRHGAAFSNQARARGCRTSCLKPPSALPNRATCGALILTSPARSCRSASMPTIARRLGRSRDHRRHHAQGPPKYPTQSLTALAQQGGRADPLRRRTQLRHHEAVLWHQRVRCIGLDRNRCHLNLMGVAINLRRARVLAALMPPVCQVPSKAAKDVMT